MLHVNLIFVNAHIKDIRATISPTGDERTRAANLMDVVED